MQGDTAPSADGQKKTIAEGAASPQAATPRKTGSVSNSEVDTAQSHSPLAKAPLTSSDEVTPSALATVITSPYSELYTSTVVHLPASVPELIRLYTQSQQRCNRLCACFAGLRSEANRLSGSSPHAATALKGVMQIVGEDLAACDAGGADVATGGTPSRTPAPSTTRQVTPSPARGAVVSGAVVTGKVVAGTPSTGGNAGTAAVVAAGAVVTSTTAAPGAESKSRITRFFDEVKRDYKEEYNVLLMRVMAMDAAQALLEDTQLRLTAAEATNTALQAALREGSEKNAESQRLLGRLTSLKAGSEDDTRPDTEGVKGDKQRKDFSDLQELARSLAAAQDRAATLEANLTAAVREREEAQYAAAQLETGLRDCREKLAFTRERNEHLEGQVQRILSSAAEQARGPPPRIQTGGAAGAPASVAASTGASNSGTPMRPTGVSGEAYNKAAMEKQVAELRGLLDRQHEASTKEAARRKKLEEAVRGLTKETTEQKAALLKYQRQLNESELTLEREAGAREDTERVRALEKECAKLRSAFRERKQSYESDLAQLSASLVMLKRTSRLQCRAGTHLMHAVKDAQVRVVLWRSLAFASNKDSCSVKEKHTEDSKSEPSRRSPANKEDLVTTFPSSSPTIPNQNRTDLMTSSQHSSPIVREGDKKMLAELRETYERRVEAAESRCKVEVRQLQLLNKELRQALAISQEDLQQKSRMLEMFHQRQESGLLLSPVASSLKPGTSQQQQQRQPSYYQSSENSMTLREGSPRRRTLSEIDQLYDPERMSNWEAVQIENEALLNRLSLMQEDKWSMGNQLEDLQARCAALQEELNRKARELSEATRAGAAGIAGVAAALAGRGGNASSEDARLRSLQTLLQETLGQRIVLETQVAELQRRLSQKR